MTGLATVVACVSLITGLAAPATPIKVEHVAQARMTAAYGRPAATVGGLFWPFRIETGVPTIWLGPDATEVTLAHEVTHWMQMKAGIPYWHHDLPHFVERKYAAWCIDEAKSALR